MAAFYGSEKVSLRHVLLLVCDNEVTRYAELVARVVDTFDCSERTAKDALSVLRDANYVVARSDPSDRRVRLYSISERGLRVLEHRNGATLLRYVRKLWTSCQSRRLDKWRYTQGQSVEELIESQMRVEDRLLADPVFNLDAKWATHTFVPGCPL